MCTDTVTDDQTQPTADEQPYVQQTQRSKNAKTKHDRLKLALLHMINKESGLFYNHSLLRQMPAQKQEKNVTEPAHMLSHTSTKFTNCKQTSYLSTWNTRAILPIARILLRITSFLAAMVPPAKRINFHLNTALMFTVSSDHKQDK